MKKTSLLCLALALPATAFAAPVPSSGFFAGAGGSYNSSNFGGQGLYAIGTSDTYSNGVVTNTGTADGPTVSVPMDEEASFAPAIQGGYFRHFKDSQWLWGAKFSYRYLDTTSTEGPFLVPQYGAFTNVSTQAATPFVGNAIVGSYQVNVSHQLMLTPMIGRSYDQGFMYFGAGPSLSRTKTKVNNVVGFADLNGQRTDVSGAPQSFSSSQWVYGATAVMGTTYFLMPSWFVDVNYTYNRTQNQQDSYFAPFASTTNGVEKTGTLTGLSSGYITTQALMVSINKTF